MRFVILPFTALYISSQNTTKRSPGAKKVELTVFIKGYNFKKAPQLL